MFQHLSSISFVLFSSFSPFFSSLFWCVIASFSFSFTSPLSTAASFFLSSFLLSSFLPGYCPALFPVSSLSFSLLFLVCPCSSRVDLPYSFCFHRFVFPPFLSSLSLSLLLLLLPLPSSLFTFSSALITFSLRHSTTCLCFLFRLLLFFFLSTSKPLPPFFLISLIVLMEPCKSGFPVHFHHGAVFAALRDLDVCHDPIHRVSGVPIGALLAFLQQ